MLLIFVIFLMKIWLFQLFFISLQQQKIKTMIFNIISTDLMSAIGAELWWTIAVIIAVISLCIIGYFYKPEDGPIIIAEIFLMGLAAAFWPIVIAIAIIVGGLALPVLLGMYIKKFKSAYDQVKKEELEAMSDAERILKK